MRQTFVVVSIVAGLLLWVVAIVNAAPAKPRLVHVSGRNAAVLAVFSPKFHAVVQRLDARVRAGAGVATQTP